MRPAFALAAVAGALLVVAAVGCGGGSESGGNSATTTSATAVKREIPQPPSNLTFAYGFADTTCGSQGLTFEHHGVEREVFVCIGSELPELKGKAPCFVGQPSPDTTGTNMVGQYDVNTKSVVPGGTWPQPCAATFASMLQWYYHKERGTLRQATPESSTNAAPAEAPPGKSGVLQVKRSDSLTCYSTSQKYTFPNGESALVGICEADDGAQTCASYQQSSGRVVTIGFPDSPWQPECLAARRMVESYKSGELRTDAATSSAPAAGDSDSAAEAQLREAASCEECTVTESRVSTVDPNYGVACVSAEGRTSTDFYVKAGTAGRFVYFASGENVQPDAIPARVLKELSQICAR